MIAPITLKKLQYAASISLCITYLYFSFFVSGANIFPGNLQFSSTLDEVAKAQGEWDWKYWGLFARDFSNFQLQRDEFWILRLWPPGMPSLFIFTNIFVDRYFVLFLSIIVAIIWLFIIWKSIQLASNVSFVLLLMVFWMNVLNSRTFNYHIVGPGRLYSESFGIGLFIIGMMYVLTLYYKDKIEPRWSSIAVVTIALSIYIKAVNDLIMIVFALMFIVTTCTSKFKNRKHNNKFTKKNNSRTTKQTININIIRLVLAIELICLPWRILVFSVLSPGNYLFASTDNQMWINQWKPSEIYVSGPWVSEYGSNGFCQAYPKDCVRLNLQEGNSELAYSGNGVNSAKEFRNQAIKSVIHDPLPWIKSRMNFHFNRSIDVSNGFIFGNVNSIIFHLLLIGLLGAHLKRLLEKRQDKIGLISLISISIGSIAPLYIGQFETRYLIYEYVIALIAIVSLSNYNKVASNA